MQERDDMLKSTICTDHRNLLTEAIHTSSLTTNTSDQGNQLFLKTFLQYTKKECRTQEQLYTTIHDSVG
jgi:hypothetical protein